jgi:hypothetical protein
MDIYEHATNPLQIKKIGQAVIDAISIRPYMTYQKKDNGNYFAKNYFYHCKSLQEQSSFIEEIYMLTVQEQRQYVQNYDCKSLLRRLNANGNETVISPVGSGLPKLYEGHLSIPLHSPSGISIDILEFANNMDAIIDILDNIDNCVDEFASAYDIFYPSTTCERVLAEFLFYKEARRTWDEEISNIIFQETNTNCRKILKVEDVSLLENPYLCDMVLHEMYRKQNDTREKERSKVEYDKNLFHRFNDPSFCDAASLELVSLFQFLLLRHNLIFTWYDTELLKKGIARQLEEMNLKDYEVLSNLRPLPFDQSLQNIDLLTRLYESLQKDDDDDGELFEHFLNDGFQHELNELAHKELDNLVLTETLVDIPKLMPLLSQNGIRLLTTAYRTQLIEFSMSLSQFYLHEMLLRNNHFFYTYKRKERTHLNTMKRQFQDLNTNDDTGRVSEDDFSNKTYPIPEYKEYVLEFVTLKKRLRKTMLIQYATEYYNLTSTKRLSQMLTFDQLSNFKYELFETYHTNLTDFVIEVVEKLEISNLYLKLNHISSTTVLGVVVFKTDTDLNLSSSQSKN